MGFCFGMCVWEGVGCVLVWEGVCPLKIFEKRGTDFQKMACEKSASATSTLVSNL